MKKTTCLIVSILIIQSGTAPACAIERKHRPWLMVRSKSAAKDVIASEAKQSVLPHDRSPRPPRTAGGPRDDGRRVVQQALNYKGTRYKFGGTTKKGMDCSGLVARVWADLKMKKIPRASSALYNSGQPVHLAELRPGDLVFFKNTYKHGISHVGVYAGDNKFVHASGHRKGVTITRLSDPYYQLHYAGARRLY